MAKKTSLEELYAYLREFHLSDGLYLIGMINAAMKYGSEQLSTDGISYPVYKWLNKCSKSQRLEYLIQLTKMARFLLLSGANDKNSRRLELNTPIFERAVDLVGSLYDEDVEVKVKTAQDRSKLLGRIVQTQFPLQDSRKLLIGRGFLIFIVIPRLMDLPYSFEAKMREHFGLGSFEFMATGMVAWMKTNGTHYYDISIEIKALKPFISDENQLKFLSLSSGTHQEFKELVRGESWQKIQKLSDIYGPNPFVKIPAIKVEGPPNSRKPSYVVPQPKYLLDRASSGIFHLLAAKEQELALQLGRKGENPFRVAFGEVFRYYVGMQLGQNSSGNNFVDLDRELILDQSMKKPDFAIVSNGICVLFEVKTSLLKIESRIYFEESTLRSEVKAGNLKKAVQQLNAFKEAILAGQIEDKRLREVRRVISVIVGYEDIFVLNSSLLPLLQEEYGIRAADLQLASVSDIDAIGSILADHIDLGQLIAEKLDAPGEDSWSLEAWLRPRIKSANPILSEYFDSFLKALGIDDMMQD